MTTKTELNGKPAVKINCKKVIWGNTPKASMYNINGDEKWVPASVSRFDKSVEYKGIGDIEGVLTVQEWFYRNNIKS